MNENTHAREESYWQTCGPPSECVKASNLRTLLYACDVNGASAHRPLLSGLRTRLKTVVCHDQRLGPHAYMCWWRAVSYSVIIHVFIPLHVYIQVMYIVQDRFRQ